MQTIFPTPASALDPNYYVTNFFLVLNTVVARDQHLFSEEELLVFQQLGELEDPAQRLWIRLYNRKGPLFRLPLLAYGEIGDILAPALVLNQLGLAVVSYTFDTPTEVVETLRVEEIRQAIIASKQPVAKSLRRPDLVQKIAEQWEVNPQVRAHVTGYGPWISLQHRSLLDRVVRLFFLNVWQGPGTLLAVDLAHVRYPAYVMRRSRPVFPTREDWMSWEAALAWEQQLWRAAESGDAASVSQILGMAAKSLGSTTLEFHPFLARFEAGWVWCRCLGQGVALAERSGQYDLAVQWLTLMLASPWEPGRRGDRWERLILDLSHLSQGTRALEVCEQALRDPGLAAHHRQQLSLRLSRLRGERATRGGTHGPRRAKVERHFFAKVLGTGMGQRTVFEGQEGQPVLVEALALERYAQEGWQGIHSENLLFTTLFGLLMWDVIFADIPDVFQTPWQDAPLDLGTDVFLKTRESDIITQLDKIREGDFGVLLESAWSHRGEMCRGVVWDLLPLGALQRLCALIGGSALASIMMIMAEDYRRQSKGFPDLCLWQEKAVRLVEVKGPRDRLSGEQQLWQQRLASLGVDVELCLIEEEPADPGPR